MSVYSNLYRAQIISMPVLSRIGVVAAFGLLAVIAAKASQNYTAAPAANQNNITVIDGPCRPADFKLMDFNGRKVAVYFKGTCNPQFVNN